MEFGTFVSSIGPQSTNANQHRQNDALQNTFQPFPRLPAELRLKVWAHYLEDSEQQMYRFDLLYSRRNYSRDWRLHTDPLPFLPDDRISLQPAFHWTFDPQNTELMKTLGLWFLKQSTRARRIASSTCLQSRQVVLQLFPDTLKFQCLPLGRIHSHGYYNRFNDYLERCPEHILRFNGAKDIFVFNATWSDQEAAVKIGEFHPSENFLKIRHVGIAVDDFKCGDLTRSPGYLYQYGTRECGQCKTQQCSDCCRFEPLPAFIRLFPLIEKLYIAALPKKSTHRPCDGLQVEKSPSTDMSCPCPDGQPKHSWPLIKSSDACGWFAIYDERSPCAFPKLSKVEEVRSVYRAHFPYYQALSNLEIRFIQPLQRECKHCVYTD